MQKLGEEKVIPIYIYIEHYFKTIFITINVYQKLKKKIKEHIIFKKVLKTEDKVFPVRKVLYQTIFIFVKNNKTTFM